MTIGDYLIAAPWWHWVFFLIIAALLAKWRPFEIRKDTHNHEHKHIHNGKDAT